MTKTTRLTQTGHGSIAYHSIGATALVLSLRKMRKSEFSEPQGKRPHRIFDPPVTREAEGDDGGYAIPAKVEFSGDD